MATPCWRTRSRDAAGLFIVQTGDVDVGHAGVTAVGCSRRPAHKLDAGEPLIGSEGEHFVQAEFAGKWR